MKTRVLSKLKWLISKSVFAPIGKGAAMEAILAALFHRASATIYMLYGLWAIIGSIYGVPSLIAANGVEWQTLFSIAVAISAAPACFGATFWPSFARMEAFAGTFFVGLILLYMGFLIANQVNQIGTGSWSGVFLIASILVIPTCRCVVVIIFLLRQAAMRDKAYKEYLEARGNSDVEAGE